MGLSVVVPVYNSETILPLLVERVAQVLTPRSGTVEMILIDDGSRDRSWDAIERLVSAHPWIRGLRLARNSGQHNALLCGIRAARFEIVVTIDDDLQNPPEEIPHLLRKLEEGFDVVYGTPLTGGHGFLRNTASKLTKISLQHAMGSETARHVSAFRAFRTNLRDAFAHSRGSYVSIDVLLTWGTTRFASVRVPNHPRTIGVSNYTVRKLIVHAMNLMTGFSTLPLEIASLTGFVSVLFGFALLAWVLLRWLVIGSVVPGFAFLASAISIFSGVQLFAIGVMGEYLARMHVRLMDRPSYVVREAADGAAAADDLHHLVTSVEQYAGVRGAE